MKRRPIGLALAGGGPFGAIYERLRIDVLEDESRRLDVRTRRRRHAQPGAFRLRGTAQDLRDTLVDLRRWIEARKVRPSA